MAYQTFTHQVWGVMVCYDLAHQIRCAKHTFSGWCDFPPMVCCSFCGHITPQFLQCRKQEGMVERLGEMRKGRRERIVKGSREGIEKETKRQFEEEGGPERPPLY